MISAQSLSSTVSQPEFDPREEIKLFCINMDGVGLRSFINDNRKDLANLRTEIAPALRLAADPAKLIMDAMVGFYPSNVLNKGPKEPELYVNRRTCILLLEKLNDINPNISDQVKATASKTALDWKDKITDIAENPIEGCAFLQLLATYKLTNEFHIDGIMDIVIPIARRKPTIDVCKEMGIDDKIPEDEAEFIRNQGDFIDQEAERRKAVIHAIKNAETESLLAYIRLLCSKLTDEQLKTPETEFFKENFPNLLLLRNKRYPLFELKRKDDGDGTEMVCFSALMKQIEENMENATKLND
ncbi:hypothetical protein ZOSMA_12G00400 [Zostera marina]|uniref:FRIGIDA-like protein n=1 Tax=Zostera marina TaxID=29655 RepID=A0A0K9PZB6_ZOSMR|nr:hypothetical protein ZOSMA_12G00400 [Zostera marina]